MWPRADPPTAVSGFKAVRKWKMANKGSTFLSNWETHCICWHGDLSSWRNSYESLVSGYAKLQPLNHSHHSSAAFTTGAGSNALSSRVERKSMGFTVLVLPTAVSLDPDHSFKTSKKNCPKHDCFTKISPNAVVPRALCRQQVFCEDNRHLLEIMDAFCSLRRLGFMAHSQSKTPSKENIEFDPYIPMPTFSI